MRFFIVLFFIGMLSCSPENKEEISSVNEIEQIDFSNGNNVLIDVRSPEEFAEGHIPNALNIDVNAKDFEDKIDKLDNSKTYYVYCKAGVRSSKACAKLQQKGFKNLVNLEDGYKAYKQK